jgi:hypothetical protein
MKILSTIEDTLAEFAATVGPWLAPLPSAFFVWRAGTLHLAMPAWVALVTAGIIELLGLATTAQALTIYEYNTARRRPDQRAPLALAIALIAVYFFGVLALTVALEVFPQLATVAPALFPILSLTGVGVLALRMDHRRRLAEVENERMERKAARQERKTAQETPQEVAPVAQVPAQEMTTTARVLAYYRANPHGSQQDAGRAAQVSRQRVAQILTGLETEGVITRNGKVEVVA